MTSDFDVENYRRGYAAAIRINNIQAWGIAVIPIMLDEIERLRADLAAQPEIFARAMHAIKQRDMLAETLRWYADIKTYEHQRLNQAQPARDALKAAGLDQS